MSGRYRSAWVGEHFGPELGVGPEPHEAGVAAAAVDLASVGPPTQSRWKKLPYRFWYCPQRQRHRLLLVEALTHDEVAHADRRRWRRRWGSTRTRRRRRRRGRVAEEERTMRDAMVSASGQARAGDARRGLAAAGSGARTTQGAGPRVPARRMISARSEGIESWAGSGVRSRGHHSHRIGRARPASFMTMADVSAPSAPAAGQQEGAQPTWGETLSRIVRSALMYVSMVASADPARGEADHRRRRRDVARGPVARRVSARCLRGEPLDFTPTSPAPRLDSHGDLDALVEIDTGVPPAASRSPPTATGTSPGTEDTGEREYPRA